MRSAHARFRDNVYYLTLPSSFSFSTSLKRLLLFLFPRHSSYSPQLSFTHATMIQRHESHVEEKIGIACHCLTRITRATSILKTGWSLTRILISRSKCIFVIIFSERKEYQRTSRRTSDVGLVQFSKAKNNDMY